MLPFAVLLSLILCVCRLVFTILFFFFESVIRIIVMIMPKFLLKGIDLAIDS